jgi:seryl-tRNA synthetase
MSGWFQCRLTFARRKSSAACRNYNYQRADGSVEVPVALQPYMGGLKELRP